MCLIVDAEDRQRGVAEFIRDNIHAFYNEPIMKWEYGGQMGKAFVRAAIDEQNRIVGLNGYIPIELVQGKKIIRSAKSESTFFLPEKRGSGLFEELYNTGIRDTFQSGIECIWGFTKLTRLMEAKFGFRIFDDIMCLAQINLSAIKKLKLIRAEKNISYSKKLAKSLYYMIWGKYRKFKIKSGNTFSIANTDHVNWSSIYKRIMVGNTSENRFVYIDHSETYVSWRFVENPVCQYELLKVLKDDVPVACFAVNITDKHKVIITDFIFNEDTRADEIIPVILNHYLCKGYAELECCGNFLNPGIKRIFLSLKYFNAKLSVSPFLGFIYIHLLENKITPEDWFLTGAWTEGFKM